MSGRYIRQKPFVDNHGIYVPEKEYVPEGCEGAYRCIMTREMFIEAYDKWIRPQYDTYDPSNHDDDDADCWCE